VTTLKHKVPNPNSNSDLPKFNQLPIYCDPRSICIPKHLKNPPITFWVIALTPADKQTNDRWSKQHLPRPAMMKAINRPTMAGLSVKLLAGYAIVSVADEHRVSEGLMGRCACALVQHASYFSPVHAWLRHQHQPIASSSRVSSCPSFQWCSVTKETTS